jgi:hypothetical protein
MDRATDQLALVPADLIVQTQMALQELTQGSCSLSEYSSMLMSAWVNANGSLGKTTFRHPYSLYSPTQGMSK